jgi:hypothetical protein
MSAATLTLAVGYAAMKAVGCRTTRFLAWEPTDFGSVSFE